MRDAEGEASAAASWRTVPECLHRLRGLRCLVAVARSGSTRAATDEVHLSQPAVARAVLELEKALGVPLFERGPRGMVPTAPGAAAARRAALLIEQLDLGAREAHALAHARGRRAFVPGRLAQSATTGGLRAMLAVAAVGSEAGAARALSLSQPAVHRALRGLEHLAGAPLFLKSVRGTRATESGEALLRRVKLAIAEARALEADVDAWRGTIRGRIVVGALPLTVSLLLPAAIEALLARHPEVDVTVVDGTYESLMRQLRSADVDLLVGALRPGAPADTRQEPLLEEDLVVVARPGHPCLARRTVAPKDLLRWPWILPLPDTPAHAALRRAFDAFGLPLPADGLSANSPGFTRATIAATDRLALASRGPARQEERAGRVAIVPVALPGTMRPIGMTTRAIGEPSPDLAALMACVRDAAAARA
jgi:LysR family transcriptional regulator of gallate degradation